MKKIHLKKIALLLSLSIIITSCSTKGRALMYTETSISPQDVKARTVAIVPNRLPVTLQNAEKWRVANYETIKQILVKKGYSVIDYNTCNDLFKQSGLPIEDTKSSRDKYAELAQKMNADLLVFPYYGTTFTSNGFVNNYVAIASLQFYSTKHNDFSTRIDLEGVHKIHIWPSQVLPYAGMGLSFVDPALSFLGLSGMVWGVGAGVAGRSGHKKAFKKGIKAGLDLYFSKYSPSNGNNFNNSNNTPTTSNNNVPTNSNTNISNNQPNTNFNNNVNSNKSTDPNIRYANYSVAELEALKKAAVTNGDFKTAQDVKEQIEKRNKK